MTSPGSTTIAAELTPPGRGAVAVVVVDGPLSLQAVGNCFHARSERAIQDIPIGRISFGHWGEPTGEELIVCRRDEQRIEVHCHGGGAAVEAIIGRLLAEGCQRITWQEWVKRESPDPIRSAAHIALAKAMTERTAAILLDQFNGALSEAIRRVVSAVTVADWPMAENEIDQLLSRQKVGQHLIHPWRVVVFGPPNVGKSSLMNALAGYSRAIVSPIPGTTRDVVTLTTAIDGWPIQLSDTAGFRETDDDLETAGIQLATRALARAELAIFVHDATTLEPSPFGRGQGEGTLSLGNPPPIQPAPQENGNSPTPPPAIHVLNKVDLVPPSDRPALIQRICQLLPEGDSMLPTSALNKEGIAELIATIARLLVPQPIPTGSAVPFSTEQIDALAAAKLAVERRDASAAIHRLQALLAG